MTDKGESRTTTIPGDDSNVSRGRVSSWSSGLSGFADLLRRARAESRLVLRRAAHARHPRIRGRLSLKPGAAAPLHKRRDARHEHYVVAAAIAAAAALAALLALVSGARFPNVPGAGGGHRAEGGGTLERQSRTAPVTTTNQTSPTTVAETGPPTLPPSDPVAIPGTTAPAHVPRWPFSNTRDPVQLSSGWSPPPSGCLSRLRHPLYLLQRPRPLHPLRRRHQLRLMCQVRLAIHQLRRRQQLRLMHQVRLMTYQLRRRQQLRLMYQARLTYQVRPMDQILSDQTSGRPASGRDARGESHRQAHERDGGRVLGRGRRRRPAARCARGQGLGRVRRQGAPQCFFTKVG